MKSNKNAAEWAQWVRKLLPVVFFFFAFCLYFSLLSEPYFTDEQDVIFGGYNIAKGRDVYKSYLSQHMPFSYYFAAIPALLGARTIYQFRIGAYLMLSFVWELIFLRHRSKFHVASLFAMPLLYLFMLKNTPLGTVMISDHWQGIGQVIVMLELIRYSESRDIGLPCAGMVSLGIVLSFGTVFVAAYPLFCCFLGVAIIQIQYLRQIGKKEIAERKRLLRKAAMEDLRLVLICLAPFILLAIWYLFSGNLENAVSGAYTVNTQFYSKYTGGFGSNPLSIVWETFENFARFLSNSVQHLQDTPWPCLLIIIQAVGLAAFCISLGRRSIIAAGAVFLSAIYSGVRSFDSFHGMPYIAMASAAIALGTGELLQKKTERKSFRIIGWIAAGGIAAVLLSDFVIWFGYNILYPQILRYETASAETQILDLLTEPEEEVHSCDTPIFSQSLMDLDLIPQEACDAVSIPWYYDMWSDRQMASIRKEPHILLYDREEKTWGYVLHEHAPEFDAFVAEHYSRLPQSENIWVSNDFYPEAKRKLSEAGYGNRVLYNIRDITVNRPSKYFSGQSVKAEFIAEGTNLTAVYFCAASYHRRSFPVLAIQVSDSETGIVLGKGTITGENIADTFFSRCPAEGKLVQGKRYEIEIVAERIEGKGDMEFYFTPAGELAIGVEYGDGSGIRVSEADDF